MPPQDPNQPPIPTHVRPLPKAPAEPLQSTPYDFIINPSVKPPKKAFSLGGGTKLVYVAAGGVLLVVVLFVVLSLTNRSTNASAITSVAQQQAEIARVAALHYSDLQDPNTKNFAIATQLSLTSAQQNYLQYLSSNGASVSDKQIALGTNTQTDTALDNAKASGNLDSTVKSTLRTELAQYQQTVQTAYNASSNSRTKALLKELFDQATLLLEQSKS